MNRNRHENSQICKKEEAVNMCKAIEEMIEEATEKTAKETARNM